MHSLYLCLKHGKNRKLLIWGESHTLKSPLAATSGPAQAAHNSTDSSAWFWKQPCVFPRGILSSLGAWHPEAYTGKLKRVHLHVERGSGEIALWARSLSTPRAGLTGAASPLHHLRQQLKPLGARWHWISHISPPQACLPHWRIFCLSWAFALHLSPK